MAKIAKTSGLMAARICHDLANPLGAIGNGLELMELSGVNLGEEGALIQASLTAAKARLTLFRLTYGSHGPEDRIGAGDVAKAQAAWNTDARLQIELPAQEFKKSQFQRALLAMQCVETALPLGGTAMLKVDGPKMIITATGRKIAMNLETWGIFSQPELAKALEPKTVQFALLAEAGVSLDVKVDDTQLTVSF